MEKKNLDWENLGFSYMTTDYRYVADYKDGAWEEGRLTTDSTVALNECAGILQYCQEIFEGLKAYTTEEGHIVTFRPDLNAQRMVDSAKRLEMPPFPVERFLEALDEVTLDRVLMRPGCPLTVAALRFTSARICSPAVRSSASSRRTAISSGCS